MFRIMVNGPVSHDNGVNPVYSMLQREWRGRPMCFKMDNGPLFRQGDESRGPGSVPAIKKSHKYMLLRIYFLPVSGFNHHIYHYQRRKTVMPDKIEWHTDLDRALTAARGSKKAVLLDFFNPG